MSSCGDPLIKTVSLPTSGLLVAQGSLTALDRSIGAPRVDNPWPIEMNKFLSIAEIPIDCVVAPSAYHAPRPGAEPVGRFDGMVFYRRSSVGELRSREDWAKLERRVNAGERPLAHRGSPEHFGVYAEWQTSAR